MKNSCTILFLLFTLTTFAQSGSIDPTFNPTDTGFGNGDGANNTVTSIDTQADGKIIIVGGFSSYNGTVRNFIARLNVDGTLDGTFSIGSGADGVIYSSAIQADGKIIIGGNFISYNGTARSRIARLNTNGTLDATFNPGSGVGVGNYISGICIQPDGKIIIVGTFTSYNGTARNRIARLNTNGTLDGTFNPGSGANDIVYATILQDDGKIIIGGSFTSYNGTARNHIARINTNGTLDATFNPGTGANDIVNATTLQDDGKIIISGSFTSYNGTARNYIARLNADGTLDGTFSPGTGANNYIYTSEIQTDGKIIIGGYFTSYNGTARSRIARINIDGTLDLTFNTATGLYGYVRSTCEQADGKIIIGGDFTSCTGNHITRMNADGSFDGTFTGGIGTGANKTVITSAIQANGKIVIGGGFTSYNGQARSFITRLNTNGSLDGTFNTGTGTDGNVAAIAIQADGKIIIGGYFTSYNGTSRNSIARLNTDGTIDATFNPSTGANYSIKTIAIQTDGKIIIGGWFNSYITRLNADGTLDGSFNSGIGADSDVNSITIQANGKIIIGGDFTSYDGTTISGIARLNTDGTLDGTFNPGMGTDSGIQTTAIQADGKIIIGGHFTSYNGTAMNYIARLNNDGSLDGTFNSGTSADNVVNTIAIQIDGKIIIGGYFNSYDGSVMNYIARLNTDGILDNTFNTGTGANYEVDKISIQADGKIIIVGDFTSYNGTGRNRVARILNPSKGVFGSIFLDSDQNCIKDATEIGLSGRRVTINPGNIIAETNSVGQWFVDSLGVGNYSISVDSTLNWIPSCSQVYSFTVSNANEVTTSTSIGLINTSPCTAQEISIYAPFLRRCFSNQKVYIQACNNNLATGALNSAYTIVELDSLLTPTSSTLSYNSLGNHKYRFNLGNINPGQCLNFNIDCNVSCNTLNLQTLCMETKLYPADACVFDTITNPFPTGSVTPCNLPWDNSSLKVSGLCQNDSIIFTVTNSGSGNMTCYAPIRIYIDGLLTQMDSVLLTAGQTTTYTFAVDGRTWRLEADQHPLHPGNSHPNKTIEACGNISNWTPDLVNILPQDDADAVNDIYCGLVTGSYDPNDKTGFPLGVGTTHNVLPNGELEYLIRFQNTGTDTAFTVVIRDTLSPNLDVFSIRSGVSSHNYSFKLYGPRIAEWTFNNILLPDSTTNQAASNGFVKFRIKQNRNLPDGTQIKNSADIYFDYNAPVITNQTLHTIDRMLVQPYWDGERTITTSSCASYTFNNVNYINSGTYFQRVTTATTDSLITINLTIKNNSSNTINPVACASYTAPDGAVYTTSGTKTAIIPNVAGCDSTITINLTIKNNSSNTINPTACTSYTAPDGAVYTTSGTKTAIIPNAAGCDSIITINLTINDLPDANVTQNDIELNATLAGANYQWIDCSNGNTPIVSQNAQNFTATTNGDYAVIVTQNSCSDTSDCYTISTVGISENKNNNSIQIYPNPSNGFVTIANDNNFLNATIKFTTIEGALVYQKENLTVSSLSIDLSTVANGVYFIQIIEQNRISNYKLIKN